MEYILLLITAPLFPVTDFGTNNLSDRVVERIREIIGSRCSQSIPPRWLAANEAWEAHCRLDDHDESAAKFVDLIAGASNGLPIDIHLIENTNDNRRKKLLIADMDSTIINQECIDEIADFAGLKDRVSQITERAMRGELDFDAALIERVGLLKGLGEDKLQQVFEERLTLMRGARTLVQTMRTNGAYCALVSGGFNYFTSRIAGKVGFHVNQANELEVVDGKLTGTVATPILGRQAKLDALQRIVGERDIKLADTLAVGDGANDLAMIKTAGLGIAYRAKPIVAAQATASVIHGDLTSLLYLQGYTRGEFVMEQS